ncbi:MAG: cupin domain-containing protein [Chloroflexi bacterium]|nr:cupin domain-containing protein [Chloroflexota bacterium]
MTTSKPELREDQERIVQVGGYAAFQATEGIPIITGFAVDDLRAVEVKPWARLECLGTYINLDGAGNTNDAYVAEIEPGKKMAPERHLFEKNIYVLSGRGATLVGDDPKSRISFEWHKGSVFSVPINTWHQHLNGSGTEPARFVAVTTAPLTMNLFHNDGFIFDNPYVFEDRVSPAKAFSGEGTMFSSVNGRTNAWETNFVPDIETFTTFTWKERGAGGAHIKLELAEQTQTAHISEFPVGTYKKAHRHGPGAHVIIVKGMGYSLLWPSHGSPHDGMERVDWKPGAMVVPPNGWFHQHFNGGTTPARYLAFRWNSQKYFFSLGSPMEGDTDVSVKLGGGQIEYEDEEPMIHELFEEALAKVGTSSQMAEFIPRLRG